MSESRDAPWRAHEPGEPQQDEQKRRGEPLQVHGGCGEECLDAHVAQPATHSAREPVPRFGLAVEAFRPPAVALVKALVLG